VLLYTITCEVNTREQKSPGFPETDGCLAKIEPKGVLLGLRQKGGSALVLQIRGLDSIAAVNE